MVVSRRSTRMPASSSSSAFTTMSSAKQKLVISRPPMLTLPSWSSNASHMILTRKMLKRVGESRHPCRTPTVVLSHSPVLPLNRTALWAALRIAFTKSQSKATGFTFHWSRLCSIYGAVNLMDFDQTLHIHSYMYRQDPGWDCYTLNSDRRYKYFYPHQSAMKDSNNI